MPVKPPVMRIEGMRAVILAAILLFGVGSAYLN